MTLNRVKLRHADTFMKYLVSVVYSIFLPKTLIWKKNQVSSIKFTKCSGLGKLRARWQWGALGRAKFLRRARFFG